MTAVLEELIVKLDQEESGGQATDLRGIDSQVAQHFDLSDIRRRRTYLLCFEEEMSDTAVCLAVMKMPGRNDAVLGDLLTLKAHVELHGKFPFRVLCRGSWVSLNSRVHYPCLVTGEDGCLRIELVAGTGFWPADTRFLLVDKPA